MLKATRGGYDGKGVWVCGSAAEAAEVLGYGIGLIAEEHVAFDAELAALVARSPFGQGAAYPVVQTVQRDGICREVLAPAPGLDPELAARRQALALRIAAELGVTGLLAVELFLIRGRLLVNELAMRPHNCGHWTIEGARTSQFEQHLRAVLDLPLGATHMAAPQAVMVNVLGGTEGDMLRTAAPRAWPATRRSRSTSTARRCGPAARSATSPRSAATWPTCVSEPGRRRATSAGHIEEAGLRPVAAHQSTEAS